MTSTWLLIAVLIVGFVLVMSLAVYEIRQARDDSKRARQKALKRSVIRRSGDK